MSIVRRLQKPVRRALAAGCIVLCAGGLVLARSSANARPTGGGPTTEARADGNGIASFSGPGAHGTLALSQTAILAGGARTFFADVDLYADASKDAKDRAPISMAVVLDTSGSMQGEKIDQAKRSAVELVRSMRDDDEIAFVRYASDAELVQPLARVGAVRDRLVAKIQSLEANGGTNIPPALSMGLAQLGEVGSGRVRRVVLASDGLDSSRAASEAIAKSSATRGVTISSMGIGLDFDEGYMGSVALAGHGNFAFVKDAASLATFLGRELKETAATVVENATAKLALPKGVRLLRAHGADTTTASDGSIELAMGALFAGDHRRVVLELEASLDAGETSGLGAEIAWKKVGGERATAEVARLELRGTGDAAAALASRNPDVLADATSVVASFRQIAAAEAFDRGEKDKALALIERNQSDLDEARKIAPKAAPAIAAQQSAYDGTRRVFESAAPSSDIGKAAAKEAAAQDLANLGRKAY